MSKRILKEVKNHVTTITINRPEVLNALGKDDLLEIEYLVDQINADKRCKVLIITGAGRSFIAGADISALKDASSSQAMAISTLTKRVYRKIELARPFVIAAVNGYALGGGLELALACDLRVAAEKAKLGLPETAIGSLPGSGGTQRLPRLIGLSRAKELLATAEKISAARALEIGLVDYAVPGDELLDFCEKLAAGICKNSTEAIAAGKKAMTIGMEMDMDKAMEYETALIGLNYGSHDQKEGMCAFTEKRTPNFE